MHVAESRETPERPGQARSSENSGRSEDSQCSEPGEPSASLAPLDRSDRSARLGSLEGPETPDSRRPLQSPQEPEPPKVWPRVWSQFWRTAAARGRLGPGLWRWRYVGLTLFLLFFYNSGAEWIRVEKTRVRSGHELIERGLVWPPWRALQLYVSHDSDEHLFFEYSRLILGEAADLDYIAAANLGDTQAIKQQLQQKFPQRSGRRFPYRYIAVGYPPVGLLILLLPRLFASTLAGYRLAFGVLMSVAFLAVMAVGWRLLQRCGSALGRTQWTKYTAILLFCIGPTLMMRYDIVPALLTAVVVVALIERRALLATACFLLGVAAKLYPALLLPTWLALLFGFAGTARRTAGRMLAALALLGAVAVLAMWARGATLPLSAERITFSVRPFQLESIPGALLALPQWPASLSASFGSYNAQSALAARLLPYWELLISLAALSVAGLAFVWAARRRHLAPPEQGQALCVWTLTALLFNLCVTKVLSAQYLIWCLPFAALVPGRRGRFILAALAVTFFLTQAIYPTLYGALLAGSGFVFALLLLRNAALCLICGLCLFWLWRGQLTPTEPKTGTPCPTP